MSFELDKGYIETLLRLKDRIRQARVRAVLSVNKELLSVYWEIGNTILIQQKQEGWGTKIIERLAADLRFEFQDMKGFSIRNIRYMRAFAEAFPKFVQPIAAQFESTTNQQLIIVQQLAAQLPWGHHQLLLDKVKTEEERNFYIQKTVESGWSRNVLAHQIESGLFKSQGALVNNFSTTISAYQSELTQQVFKDPYNFDFIKLGTEAKERDLEDALMTHVTKVLLELGVGFGLMGRQKRFEAGGREFFVDLLFYHTKLRRHVIIELKIGEFEPEYVSKMGLYLGLADDQLRGELDEASIGIILCKTNNRVVAEYALRDTSKPIGIAEYKIAERLPEDIKGELPSIEEIEEKLGQEFEKPQNPLDTKLARIKELTKSIKRDTLKEKNNQSILELFKTTLPQIEKRLRQRLDGLIQEFKTTEIDLFMNNQFAFVTLPDLELAMMQGSIDRLGFRVGLKGFIKAETKAFDVWADLIFDFQPYCFYITLDTKTRINERLYDHPWTDSELQGLVEQFAEYIVDLVTHQIERLQQS